MPLPDLNAFCVKLSVPGELCVQLPGGAKVCASFPDAKIPSGAELSGALLGQMNVALAPLMPLFDILNVLVSLVDCVKAVEQCLGPPPNPTELIKCFPNLAKAMAEVLKLIPQLSIPVLIADILDVLIAYLTGVRAQILSFITKQLRIASAQLTASKLGSLQLQVAIDCASDDLNVAMANLNQGATAFGELVAVVNLLLGLAGLPTIPTTVTALRSDASAALAPIDASIQVLTAVRRGFP